MKNGDVMIGTRWVAVIYYGPQLPMKTQEERRGENGKCAYQVYGEAECIIPSTGPCGNSLTRLESVLPV